MTRWIWYIKQIVGRLWFRSMIFGVMAVGTALLAYYFKDVIPEDFSQKIGAEAVDSLLGIIASSMLAVTTFSLSTMVAAYSAATNNVTPRSTQLLLQDRTSQNALATFIGVFIFSLVGIIALKIGIYGEGGRLILFVVTIFVIAFMILTLIRWIEYLATLGRVGQTIGRVEEATSKAIRHRLNNPYLGGERYDLEKTALDKKARPVTVDQIGYVQFVDMKTLGEAAKKIEGRIYVQSIPGTFNTPDRPVAHYQGKECEGIAEEIAKAFIVAHQRSFEQDPRFGLTVLSEIASRALSPAVNDPGTAIDVIGTAVRLLALWIMEKKDDEDAIRYPNVFVPPVLYHDLFEDVFIPIARDGSGLREVAIRVQKALMALSELPDPEFKKAARLASQDALKRAEQGLRLEDDKKVVREIATKIMAK